MEEIVIVSISLEKDMYCIFAHSVRNIPVTTAEMKPPSAEYLVIMKVLKTKLPISSFEGDLLDLPHRLI
ncbi:hypothetical protein ACTXT7_009270 [Hymenolepis weldensis]